MTKKLEEMTTAELGKLFPIIIREHDPAWPRLYQAESAVIADAVGQSNIRRISHIGSTYIPGLKAKPTIDILLEIPDAADTDALMAKLLKAGYRYTHQPKNPPPHMMFMKGYAQHGFEGQAFHLHVRYGGDWDELYFRDYLLEHPAAAAEYETVKLHLKNEFEHDREAYTEGKTGFITARTKEARKLYGNRYGGAG